MRRHLTLALCAVIMIFSIITAFAAKPTGVKTENSENETKQIVQVYYFGLEEEQNGIPESFVADGLRYSKAYIDSSDEITTDFQDAAIKKELFNSDKLTYTDFDETIEYEQDGYIGILVRDDDTFSSVSTGTKNISRMSTATKKYSGLVRNDMSAIDKSYKGMSLVGVEWYDQNGQSVRGYTEGLPGPYSATAHYKGIQPSKVSTGYTANVTYSGTISKEMITGKKVTVTYVGSPISSNNIITWIVLGLPIVCLAGGIALLVYGKKKGVIPS